jgi:glycerol-3-phosphate dehydrogenase
MKQKAAADIVIFGGGVAGLWTLNRLRQAGFSAVLFESGTLGGGQTHKAQGIIHGGMKYALQGVLTNDATAMADMPEIWRTCLKGQGEIDLSHVAILSNKNYLWSTGRFASKFTGLVASATLSSKVESLPKDAYPIVFKDPGFKGEVFSLDEMVVDVPALVRELVKNNQDAIFKIEPFCGEALNINEEGKLVSATVYLSGKALEISAQHFIFTAGAGNEVVLKRLNQKIESPVEMQRRPLHMVLVKTPFNYPLYAHCMGLGARPRITITTHYTQDGSAVWYLGGLIAEEGVERNSEEQAKAAKKELENLFPWLHFDDAEFYTFMVDRAEPKQKSGMKPESSFTKVFNNITIAWPTKLALAPKLADEIVQDLFNSQLAPQLFDLRELRAWPIPPIARPIWEDAFCKKEA